MCQQKIQMEKYIRIAYRWFVKYWRWKIPLHPFFPFLFNSLLTSKRRKEFSSWLLKQAFLKPYYLPIADQKATLKYNSWSHLPPLVTLCLTRQRATRERGEGKYWQRGNGFACGREGRRFNSEACNLNRKFRHAYTGTARLENN